MDGQETNSVYFLLIDGTFATVLFELSTSLCHFIGTILYIVHFVNHFFSARAGQNHRVISGPTYIRS